MIRRTVLAWVGVVAAVVSCTQAVDDESGTDLRAAGVAELACADEGPIAQTLSNGATWSMCWTVEPERGLVLEDVHYAPPDADPMRVLASLTLSQLEVPYDSGERLTEDITAAGFGGHSMQTLSDQECVGDIHAAAIPNIGDGTHGSSPEREVLCDEVHDAGLSYRVAEGSEVYAARRTDWSLTAISKVGWYEYLTVYTFGADGSIRPSLGATGDLSPVDYTEPAYGWPVGPGEADYAASHAHNAVWRVHWALDGEGELAVEQYDASETGEFGSQSPIIAGGTQSLRSPTVAEAEDRRWWRVINPQVFNDDEHPISYAIELGASDAFTFVRDAERHGANSGYDVAFTNDDECFVFATANREACGDGVLDFVETTADDRLQDVVSWIAIGHHHVPRDEDQSPMEVHWQGFSLQPRDLMAQRPDVPDGRSGVNGQPPSGTEQNSLDPTASPAAFACGINAQNQRKL